MLRAPHCQKVSEHYSTARTIEDMRMCGVAPHWVVCIALWFAPGIPAQTSRKPFDVRAMLSIARISEPKISPDGKLLAFTVERPNVEANTRPKQIYVVPVAGGTPAALTTEGSNQRPQ